MQLKLRENCVYGLSQTLLTLVPRKKYNINKKLCEEKYVFFQFCFIAKVLGQLFQSQKGATRWVPDKKLTQAIESRHKNSIM